MNNLPTVPDSRKHVVRVLETKEATKLANLYLPVYLRDFWLSLHPLVQTYIVDIASCGEEFFALVMMENARFEKLNMSYDWRKNQWRRNYIVKRLNLISLK